MRSIRNIKPKKGNIFKIKEPMELTRERINQLNEKNLLKFNTINNKSISERNQEIKWHLIQLSKKVLDKQDKQKLNYLIDLAQNPVVPKTEPPQNPAHSFTTKRLLPKDTLALVNERKIKKQQLLEIDKYTNSINRKQEINTKLKKAHNQIDILNEQYRKDYNYIYYLQKYKLSSHLNKINKLISKFAENKKLSNLNPNELRNKIINAADVLQNSFPQSRQKMSPEIIKYITENLFVSTKRITQIISTYKKGPKLSNSELMERTLNSIKYELIENINKKKNQLIEEKPKKGTEIKKLEDECQSMDNKLSIDLENILYIERRFPTISNETRQSLEERLNKIESILNPSKEIYQRFANPIKEKPLLTEHEKYTQTRNKAIILSKIERELHKLVVKYNLN